MKRTIGAAVVLATLLGSGVVGAAGPKVGASQRLSNTMGMQGLLSAIAVVGPTAGTVIALQQTGYLVTGVMEQSGGARLVLHPAAGGADFTVEIPGIAATDKAVALGTRVEVVTRSYGSALISSDGIVLGIVVSESARELMHSSRSLGR